MRCGRGICCLPCVPEMPVPADREGIGIVRASQDLVIALLHASPGAWAQQKQPLAHAWGARDMQLTAQIEEGDLHRAPLGQAVSIQFEELDLEPAAGVIAAVSAIGNGLATARYELRVDFEPPEAVRFGMHATLRLP